MRSFHAASVNVAGLQPDVAFVHHPDKMLQIIDIVQDAQGCGWHAAGLGGAWVVVLDE